MKQLTTDEKRIALSKWLDKDVSSWSSKTIQIVYQQEYNKRLKIYNREWWK